MVNVARFLWFVACLLFVACGDDPESPGAKSENSVIQAMDARHTTPIQHLTFTTDMGYHFVLIPSRAGRICVMLDPKHTPHYKQDPWAQNFCITEADLDTIERSHFATDTVIQVLASHVCSSADHLTNR